MKAFIYYHLSILLDFSIIFTIAAFCIGLYNAAMLWDIDWLLWCIVPSFVAAILHWFAGICEQEAAYYATNKQYVEWFEEV